ncbi:hypothetical protein TTHERM_00448600 (macronuclear) [Tetrahymena thermophila SB210]|uniref:Uncharacterized protein n=1 Tax=Tetrahymena thermophila (strain SB210) TaxID=312017 RepID=Q239F4_TETTS|nr:hypothetical protein TTHERM_00448600 [Tetrahymena thermophila SB210]EAR93016.4 hypothetical protein TTHERM_00448600 [Tetrahymena thermophila SB210]|eukprot:XP_001013261.4 hypothetical protein TTHERM_00448600 [Tetrahymena thermophila SB210]
MNYQKRVKPCLGLFIFNLSDITSPLMELSYIIISQESKQIQKVFQFKNTIPFGNQKPFLFQSLLSIQTYLKESKIQHIPVFYNTLAVSNFLFRLKEDEFKEFKKFCKNPVELFDIILPNQHFSQQQSNFNELSYRSNELQKVSQLDKEAQHYVALILYLNSNRIYFYEKCRKFGNKESQQKYQKAIESMKQRIQQINSNKQDKNVKDQKNVKNQFLESSDDEESFSDDELQKAIKLSLMECQQNQINNKNYQIPKLNQNIDEFNQMQNSNQFNNLANQQNVRNNNFQFLNFDNNYLTDQMTSFTNQQRKQEFQFKEGQEERRKKFEEIQKKQLDLFLKSESALYKEFIKKQTEEFESFQQNIKQLQQNLNNQLKF